MNYINKSVCRNCGEELIWWEDKDKWIHDFSGSIVCEGRKGYAEPGVEER